MRIKNRMAGTAAKVPRLRGSYTVEASLVVPVILLVLIYVLLTGEYLSDSARMTAVMAERVWQLMDAEETGDIRAESSGFFRLHADHMAEQVSRKQVRVTCHDAPRPAYFGESFDAELRVKRRQPVKWLRRMRQLQACLE